MRFGHSLECRNHALMMGRVVYKKDCMNVGIIALALAVTSGLTACVAAVCWGRGMPDLRLATYSFLTVMLVSVGAASVFQLTNILTHQFQYVYVANFSDRALPTVLLAATFWAGQAGSLLLWALWSSVLAGILAWRLRGSEWAPYVLAPYLAMTVAICLLTMAASPFARSEVAPVDGMGLNPLLQNSWMIIHPPILFSGFTAMAVPFAFAIGALWRGEYHTWGRLARPWALLAWVCLGAGLVLGGVWAYESLGWGGFWGWDPVENSSLVPWLVVSALIHGLILQEGRQRFYRSNLVLALLGYLLVLYSTFLTRSGILGTFSVHSFVELGMTRYLVVLIGACLVVSSALLVWRWRMIPHQSAYTRVLSREFGLLLGCILLLIMTTIVLIGTSMPVISRLPGFTHQMSVDLGFYSPVIAPFGLVVLLTMAIGPLLTWDHTRYGRLRSLLRVPIGTTVLVLGAILLLNITYPVAVFFVAGGTFALMTNVVMIIRRWRAGILHVGGYLAHAGIGLLMLGVVGTGWYKQTASLQLIEGVPQGIFGRSITFRGMTIPANDPLKREAVELEVTNPQTGQTWVAAAPYYTFAKSNQLVMHPAIDHGLDRDLYIAPSQVVPAALSGPGRLRLRRQQPQRMGGYSMTFEQFTVGNRTQMESGMAPTDVGARLLITTPQGQTSTITPMMRLISGQSPQSDPTPFAAGTMALVGMQVEQQEIELQVDAIDPALLASDDLKARVFIDISDEPGISLVWAGMALALTGGMLSGLQHWWAERRRRSATRSAAVPVTDPQPLIANHEEQP